MEAGLYLCSRRNPRVALKTHLAVRGVLYVDTPKSSTRHTHATHAVSVGVIECYAVEQALLFVAADEFVDRCAEYSTDDRRNPK